MPSLPFDDIKRFSNMRSPVEPYPTRLADVCGPAERTSLARWARAGTTPARTAFRSRLVLGVLEGLSIADVSRRHRARPATVRLWARRVAKEGIQTLWRDAPGRGRKCSLDPSVVAAVAALHAQTTPSPAEHPSLRAVARRFGISPSSVRRIWQRAGLAPTR